MISKELFGSPPNQPHEHIYSPHSCKSHPVLRWRFRQLQLREETPLQMHAVNLWTRRSWKREIGPPWFVFIPSTFPAARRLHVSPHGGSKSGGSPSKAVSRAQPAWAAACITTTAGFYLAQRRRDRGRKRVWWNEWNHRVGYKRKKGNPLFVFSFHSQKNPPNIQPFYCYF